jgi:hypothetical protein
MVAAGYTLLLVFNPFDLFPLKRDITECLMGLERNAVRNN